MEEATTKKILMTYSGRKKLEDELEDLLVNKRSEIAQKIKEAREQGDLSENAEYDAAKDEQRDIEARIEEIKKILKNAEVVIDDDVEQGKVNIGSTVVIREVGEDEEETYSIVGPTESDSLAGKISNESPIGHALMGASKGDIVKAVIKNDNSDEFVLEFEIISVERTV